VEKAKRHGRRLASRPEPLVTAPLAAMDAWRPARAASALIGHLQ
jgi:hypothetical protein